MTGSYLLDTNVVIALFAGEAPVIERLAVAEEVMVPAVVLGELYYGARKSSRPEQNRTQIDRFASEVAVLDVDQDTARIYGDIKHELHQKGRPLPENDIWIASLAQQHELTLITRDSHFTQIATIAQETW